MSFAKGTCEAKALPGELRQPTEGTERSYTPLPWLRQRALRRESEETALATPTPNLSFFFSRSPNLLLL